MTIWFTSDTHFWHKNIIRYANRPVNNAEEMNAMLINNWNNTVKDDNDEIWHLGDFAFCGREKAVEILQQLKGRKHLVVGNHDYSLVKKIGEFFETIQDYKMLKIHVPYEDDKGRPQQYHQSIVLCHFPILSWDLMRYGSIHLHGHCHGMLPQTNSLRYDVGVDCNDYRPVSFEEIQDKIIMRSAVPETTLDFDPLHSPNKGPQR